jgi:hypothetical protein
MAARGRETDTQTHLQTKSCQGYIQILCKDLFYKGRSYARFPPKDYNISLTKKEYGSFNAIHMSCLKDVKQFLSWSPYIKKIVNYGQGYRSSTSPPSLPPVGGLCYYTERTDGHE